MVFQQASESSFTFKVRQIGLEIPQSLIKKEPDRLPCPAHMKLNATELFRNILNGLHHSTHSTHAAVVMAVVATT